MTRLKSVLAPFLSFALVFGGAPARAAELARGLAVELAAPAPIVSLRIPIAAASFSISPSLTAPSAALILPSAALIPAASVPVPSVAAPALLAQPAAPAPVAAAGGAVRALAAPNAAPLDYARVFDGSIAAPAANDVEPVRASVEPASAPRLDPPQAKRPRSTAGRLLRAASVGVGAAALAPFLWSAAPGAGTLMLFAVAISPVAAAAALLLAARGVRAAYRRLSRSAPARANEPPSRRRVNAIRALGFALGVALTVGTVLEQRPLIESAHSYMDARLPADERVFKTEIQGSFFAKETARVLASTPEGRAALARVNGRMPEFFVAEARPPAEALPGTAFADATAALLSKNPVGREVLDGLRDRGGVLRMPTFFVSYQVGSAARYTPPDAVYLSVESIEEGGVTVAEFLRSPAAQAAYLEREQAIITHELKHADQARRSPFNIDTWTLLRINASRLVSAVEAYSSPSADKAQAATAGASPAPDVETKSVEASPAAAVAAVPVALDAAELARSGWTVRRFVADPRLQKEYILKHQAELAASLQPVPMAPPVSEKSAPVSAPSVAPSAPVSAERPAFHVEFGMVQEWEYEAYFTEHFYTHERLKADPAADIAAGELGEYSRQLAGFDEFLSSIDGYGIYSANFHSPSPYYAKYMADMRAKWDAHRVEGNILLARRALAHHDGAAAQAYLERARLIAAEINRRN